MVRRIIRQKRVLQMKHPFAILLSICCCLTLHAQVKKGQSAPEIKLPGLADTSVSLSSLKGKVVLVDFWASWCGPCRQNSPNLVKLYKRYHDAGFEILSVSLDKDKNAWKKAIEQDQLGPWVHVVDQSGWNAPATLQYGVDAIPATFLVDRSGVIRAVNKDGRELDYEIGKLVK
jgi:peroxiredoxin